MIITVAEAKIILGVTGSAEDDIIENMLTAITTIFETYCGRHLETASVVEYSDGSGGKNIWLTEPAESVTAVEVGWDSWVEEDSSDYILLDGRKVNKPVGSWAIGTSNIRVTYVAGYAAIPEDLRQAAEWQVHMMYNEWKAAIQGKNILASEGIAGWNQSFIKRASIDVKAKEVLDRLGDSGGY